MLAVYAGRRGTQAPLHITPLEKRAANNSTLFSPTFYYSLSESFFPLTRTDMN